MPELGICPDCLEHCNWEDEEEEEAEKTAYLIDKEK
jgi:hypothetical protein